MVRRSPNMFDEDDDDNNDNNNIDLKISIHSFLQSIESDKKTCTVKIITNRIGFISFKNGNIISATTGNIYSDEAVYEILSWEYGTYNILDYIIPKDQDKTTKNLTFLMMNYAVKKDERNKDGY